MTEPPKNKKLCEHKNAHHGYEQCAVGVPIIPGVQMMAGHCFVCADCGAMIENCVLVGYIEGSGN